MATIIAVASLILSLVLLIACCVLWVLAPRRGWLDSVPFLTHLSIAALVFAALSAAFSALAALFAV